MYDSCLTSRSIENYCYLILLTDSPQKCVLDGIAGENIYVYGWKTGKFVFYTMYRPGDVIFSKRMGCQVIYIIQGCTVYVLPLEP